MIVNVAVEGESDREAAKAVVRAAGKETGKVVAARGKTRLDPKIPKYNAAAASPPHTPWVVFRDSDTECPVLLRARLTKDIAEWNSFFCLRIAVSMTESWLLADPANFSRYFGVTQGKVESRTGGQPDSLPHAKRSVLDLCMNSSKRDVRNGMLTRDGGVGPLYVVMINDFCSTLWDPVVASDSSNSLARAIIAIKGIKDSHS